MISENFLGNEELIARLKSDAMHERTPHAIIFEGKRGSGRSSLAYELAMLLSCENSCACGNCAACKKLADGNSPDVIHTGPSEGRVQIGVDVIRSVRNDVYIRPNDNKYKAYIISCADRMTIEAQNAFLKVLEEPPEYAVFILLCESADAMLVTVKSRCAVYTLEHFSIDRLCEYLPRISSAAKELKERDADAFRLAVMSADGTVGKALEAIDGDSAGLLSERYDRCTELVTLLKKRAPTFDVLELLLSLEQKKESVDAFITMLESALADILDFKLTQRTRGEFFLSEDELERVSLPFTNEFVINAIEICERFKFSLASNANLQTAITAFAAELTQLRSRH